MQFKDVIGRDELKTHLIHTINSKRISHAQMFLAREGAGGLPMALAYTSYLFCEDKSASDSCGECRNCRRIAKLQHPDVHFSFPIQLSKANHIETSDDCIEAWRELNISNPYFGKEDWYFALEGKNEDEKRSNKQGTIGTKEAERIAKSLSLKSFEGGYKVLIMWLPEQMNLSAANKLLKLLEEPPPMTLFLLVAEQDETIISTIRSRTQIIKIVPPKEKAIETFLIQKNGVTPEEAENIAHLCERNVVEAQHLLLNLASSKFNIENFIAWMRVCYSRAVPETIDWVEKFTKDTNREQQKSFLRFCLQMFRSSIVGHYTHGDTIVMTSEQKKFLDKFAPFINHNNIVIMVEVIEEAHYHIERNANPKILFLDLSFKIFLQFKRK